MDQNIQALLGKEHPSSAWAWAKLDGVVSEISKNEDGDCLIRWAMSDTKKQDMLVSAFDFHKLEIVDESDATSITNVDGKIIPNTSKNPDFHGEHVNC